MYHRRRQAQGDTRVGAETAGISSGKPGLSGFGLPVVPRGVPAGLIRAVNEALDNRRGFVLFPFAVIAGLLSYRSTGTEPAFWLVIAACIAAAVWLGLRVLRGHTGFAASLAFGFTCGFMLLPVHGVLFGTPMLSGSAYGTYSARVEEVLDATSGGQRVIISAITPIDGRALPLRRARLFVRNADPLAPGDRVTGTIRFAEVPGPAVPGGYDGQFHAYFDGIGSFASAYGRLEITGHGDAGFDGLIAGLRHAIGSRIDAALTGTQAAVARALIIGDQSRIADETRQTMAVAGIAHVLAISGLHLSLVAGTAFAVLRLLLAMSRQLAQRVAIKKLAAGAGIVVTLAYLAISGASVSATRASVMLILVFGAMLAGRQALTMRNVAFAALFLLVTEPAGLFRPGFQLSFAAVVALIGTYEQSHWAQSPATGVAGRVWRFFSGVMVSSLVAGLATAVFAAYHFQQTAPLGILGNLVALPLLGFLVLPSLMLGVLLMPLGLDAPFLLLAGWGIDNIIAAASFVARMSETIAPRPLLTTEVLVAALAAAAWFAFFSGRLRLAGPVAAALFIAVFGFAPQPDVLVADRTQAIGLRNGSVLSLATGRANSFATNVWSDTYGLTVETGGPDLSCDEIGCIGTLPGGATVAVEKDIAGFIEDCDAAELVVTRLNAPAYCRALTEVIDRDDLLRGGVAAAYWQSESRHFAVRFAITDLGRPWRIDRNRD